MAPGYAAPVGPGATPAASAGISSPTPRPQIEEPLPAPESEHASKILRKQRKDILKANFERMKLDADELAALAKSLQEDLSKSNVNVMSLQVVGKAEKIEKLAKHIKELAKGY